MGKSFRTELSAGTSSWRINHSHSILTLGSCFSDEIGNYLRSNKFEVAVNPFGTVYDPQSISRLINYSIEKSVPKDGWVNYQGIYSHLDFHSSYNASSEEQLSDNIRDAISSQHQKLLNLDYLIITLGTSWVYRYLEADRWIANCHKIPSEKFTKELLNPREVIKPLRDLFDHLKGLNTKLKIILTVSPVRHTKDGLTQNSVSKSILRMACHYLEEDLPHVEYFPSFEIMMDDLRDYRFYKDDMIHPSEEAIRYLWQAFSDRYFSEDTQQLNKRVAKVRKAINHRPFSEGSSGHLEFLSETLQQLMKLNNHLNFGNEIKEIEERITNWDQ